MCIDYLIIFNSIIDFDLLILQLFFRYSHYYVKAVKKSEKSFTILCVSSRTLIRFRYCIECLIMALIYLVETKNYGISGAYEILYEVLTHKHLYLFFVGSGGSFTTNQHVLRLMSLCHCRHSVMRSGLSDRNSQ